MKFYKFSIGLLIALVLQPSFVRANDDIIVEALKALENISHQITAMRNESQASLSSAARSLEPVGNLAQYILDHPQEVIVACSAGIAGACIVSKCVYHGARRLTVTGVREIRKCLENITPERGCRQDNADLSALEEGLIH